ncbi:uncharacterized protein HaLaN_08837 [Haematococcus lacustris]|uniref:Glycine--tRNA ligase n=1 Tax=Haematococcus lacustris TaxID=44745 RepID=A0A699Z189_HAELA|nr:uncharacterized protein HaLaN_08837 [Haematococcus lacustris]
MGEEKKPKPMKLGEAVAKGIIGNETLAYFIGRTWLFFKRVGIDLGRMRFRQHLQHEMAHYANDCWDGEVETSYGAYDLTAHSSMSKCDLNAYEKFPEPRIVDMVKVTVAKKEVGTAFKKDAKAVTDCLEGLGECDAMELKVRARR